MRYLLATFIFYLVCISTAVANRNIILSDNEKQWLYKHDTVLIGYYEWPPVMIHSKDGVSGIAHDHLIPIFELLGLHAEFIKPDSWPEAFDLIKHKKLDMLLGASQSACRDSFMLFTSPYANFPYVIYTHQNSPVITELDDLQNKNLIVEDGFLTETYLHKKNIYPQITHCKTSKSALKLLALEKGDAYIGNIGFCTYLINQKGYANIKIAAPASMSEFPIRYGVRNDWTELQSILSKHIDNIPYTKMQSVKDKYLQAPNDFGFKKSSVIRWAIGGVTIITFVFLIILFWNRSLQKQVKERRVAELRLKQYQEKLLELNHVKDKIFSILGHDLRGPVGNIANFLSTLATTADELDKKALKSHLQTMSITSHSTFTLLQNLLYWAKLQVSGLSIIFEKIHICDLIYDTLDLLKLEALTKNIQFEIICPDVKTLEVECDFNLIATVIRNLVSNALKYSPENSKITLNALTQNNTVIIQVIDQGIGIEADQLKNIFSTSNILSTKGTKNERGTGLGLQVCKKFIEMHKGTISVSSQPQKGSTFTIMVPIKQN